MARKEFRIHHPGEVADLEQRFRIKLGRNEQTGENLLKSGELKPFRGFDAEAFRHGYSFAIELSHDSQERIINQVVIPLKGIADRHGIQAIYPGYGDISPHVVFEYAQFVNVDQDQQAQLKAKLDRNVYFAMICRILSDLDFSFDQLVIGRDSYLCVAEFNSDMYPIYKARKLIEKIFRKNVQEDEQGLHGPTPFEYKDIFHSTVMRITGLPPDKRELIAFKRDVDEKIGKSIKKSPVAISAARVFHGSPYDFTVDHGGYFSK